jgi:signal transduction histidine kinase
VDGLLLLTRAEMTELHLELLSIDIEPVIMSEVKKWRKLCENRDILVDEKVENSSTKVRIDKSRIEQVFSILLDNANKYSAKDEPIKILVGYTKKSIKISFADSGEGISGAEIENIFERFVRFSKHNEGVGLGLPIAKAIVEAHKGSISVQSIQGEGTTFTVSLPY